jgi:adenylylsulfate kinase-like enzyme
VVRFGGVAICVIISPYSEDRHEAREMIERYGRFFEIYVDTPIDECEKRDQRDFYRRARVGLVDYFTGISDVYEEPAAPDFHLYTMTRSAKENSSLIIRCLERMRLL